MASKALVENIVKLYSKLGGNIGDVLGSRSNITFLGTGKNPEPFIDMNINMEAVGALGKSKILEELKSPMGYLTANKLNDIQATKLYNNMLKLEEFYYPKVTANITDMATGTRNLDKEGLMSLRSNLSDDQARSLGINVPRNIDDLPPPGSRGGADDIAAPLQDAETTIRNLEKQDPALASQFKAIMAASNKGDIPAKRASAREFLVEALKADDTFATKLSSVISAEDVKYITEGGGGVGGDPLVLVEKYFGPRIAEMIPVGATGEEIITFTRRVMNNVEDAAGLKPDNPRFDRFTARIVEIKTPGGPEQPFAKGGRAGFRFGKGVFQGIANIFKKGADDVDLVKQEETFRTGPITAQFLGDVDKRVIDKFITSRDIKGPGSFGMYDNIAEMPQGLQAAEFISKIRIPGKNKIDYEKAEMFIGGGVKLTGKETVDELIQMYLNAMKSYKSPFKAAKGGLAKILEV
jgi:hypothetical protein